MANERTFLAWIRTSIGIIAFGFVIERFSLFMRQMAFILGKTQMSVHLPSSGYSNLAGIVLVSSGTLMTFFAFIQFKVYQQRIEEGVYRPSSKLYLLLTLLIAAVGAFLAVFLSMVK